MNVEQDAFIEQDMCAAVDIDNLALDVLYVRVTILETKNEDKNIFSHQGFLLT